MDQLGKWLITSKRMNHSSKVFSNHKTILVKMSYKDLHLKHHGPVRERHSLKHTQLNKHLRVLQWRNFKTWVVRRLKDSRIVHEMMLFGIKHCWTHLQSDSKLTYYVNLNSKVELIKKRNQNFIKHSSNLKAK